MGKQILSTQEREEIIVQLMGLGASEQMIRELDHESLKACIREKDRRGDGAARRKVEAMHEKLTIQRTKAARKTAPAKTEAGLMQAFRVFDKDGSGTIEREEFLAIMTTPLSNGANSPSAALVTREQAEMLFDEIDTDRSGVVEESEFAHAWAELEGQYMVGRAVNPALKKSKSRGLHLHLPRFRKSKSSLSGSGGDGS